MRESTVKLYLRVSTAPFRARYKWQSCPAGSSLSIHHLHTAILARSRRQSPEGKDTSPLAGDSQVEIVRSGCRTCKKRRLKCDETKSRCLRCINGQYICDGYDIIRPLSVVLLGPAQKRSLAYYKERTAVSTSSFGKTELCSRGVLQCAQIEEAVQWMVVALDALHEGSVAAPGQ